MKIPGPANVNAWVRCFFCALQKKQQQIHGGILTLSKKPNEIEVLSLGISFAMRDSLRLVVWGLGLFDDLGGDS